MSANTLAIVSAIGTLGFLYVNFKSVPRWLTWTTGIIAVLALVTVLLASYQP